MLVVLVQVYNSTKLEWKHLKNSIIFDLNVYQSFPQNLYLKYSQYSNCLLHICNHVVMSNMKDYLFGLFGNYVSICSKLIVPSCFWHHRLWFKYIQEKILLMPMGILAPCVWVHTNSVFLIFLVVVDFTEMTYRC